jgi:hypothetical protein
MTGLIRENTKFEWGELQQAAFDKLKGILCSGQVLVYPDFSKPFILTTDASKIALAAVLSQEHDGLDRPVGFASRQLNQAERNYSASEQEMLAVVCGTKHFRSYLYGRRFLVKTDHSALTYLRNFADNNARLTRWALRLADLEFDIIHKPGTQIRHVDALIRHINSVTTTQAPSKNQVRIEQLKDSFCLTRVIGKLREIQNTSET